MTDNALIRLKNVGLERNGKWLVRGVGFDIMPGQIVTMSKEAINATANAANHLASFMDSDVSLLCRDAEPAVAAREAFRAGNR